MELIWHKSIYEIKNPWRIIESGGGISPFQSYEFNLNLYKRRWLYLENLKARFLYAEIIDNGETLMIVPFIKDYSGKLLSLSDINGHKCYDVVWRSEDSMDSVFGCLDLLFNSVSGPVELDYVVKRSPLYFWAQNQKGISIEEIEQIHIPYNVESFEHFFAGLTKNARQNIRTAYNRLKNDKKEYSFECYIGRPVIKVIIDRC